MKILSLATVNVTINNANRDDVISFGGGGKLLGSVAYSFAEDTFTQVRSADGGYAVGHNASKAGTVTVSIMQTSAVCDLLDEYIIWCRDNPELSPSGITIQDTTGVISIACVDCVPQKVPDKTVSAQPQERSYTFICGEINPNEYAKRSN